MLTIPTLEIDELPMRIDGQGRLQFCKVNDEAVLASFAIGLKANAADDWEIVSIHMGTQELFGETFRRFAQHFESEHGAKISDHVGEELPDVLQSAREDAHEATVGW
jgi:hypothetical protein